MEVWKFEMKLNDYAKVEMPQGAKVLDIKAQEGKQLCLWALVEPKNELEIYKFRIAGTGHHIDESFEDLKYVKSLHLNRRGIPLVFHVFEVLGGALLLHR